MLLYQCNTSIYQPKSWTELQAGVECLTQLVLLIDGMCSSGDPSVADVAEVLQTQIIYNGEVLDNAFESLRVYKEGTQSLAYLDSSVYLAYALLRLLERSSKKERGAYVRKKAKRKSKGLLIFVIPRDYLAKRILIR